MCLRSSHFVLKLPEYKHPGSEQLNGDGGFILQESQGGSCFEDLFGFAGLDITLVQVVTLPCSWFPTLTQALHYAAPIIEWLAHILILSGGHSE